MIYDSAYTIKQLKSYSGAIKNSDTLSSLTEVSPTEAHGGNTYSCDNNGTFHFNITSTGQYLYLGNDIQLNIGDYMEFECDILNKGSAPIYFWLSPRSMGVDYGQFIITSKTAKYNEWEHINIRLLCPGRTLYRLSFGYNTQDCGEFYIRNLVRKCKTFDSDNYSKPTIEDNSKNINANKIESDSDNGLVAYGHNKVELWTNTYATILDETDGSFRPSAASSTKGLNLGTSAIRWNNVYCTVAPNVSSNRELKKDITLYNCEKAYEGIQNLNIYSYRMKDEKTFGDEVYYGSMLDELPEECLHVENQGVDLYGYTSYAISALKVAINKIKELENKINDLENEIKN